MKIVHYRRRAACLLLAGLCVLMLLVQRFTAVSTQSHGPNIQDAEARIYYRLDAGQDLTVELLPNDDLLRISTILARDRQASVDDAGSLTPYAVRVDLLDDDRKLIKHASQHIVLQTSKTRLQDADGNFYEPSFIDDDQLTLLDPRWFMVPVRRLAAGARYVRLQLAEPHTGVCFARCFRKRGLAEDELDQRWQQASFARQEHYAASHAFPPALLSQQERRQLLRQLWSSVPPYGTPDRDFSPRRLFRIGRARLDELKQKEHILTRDWVDTWRDVAYRLPEAGIYRLRAWARPNEAIQEPLQLRYRLYPAQSGSIVNGAEVGFETISLVASTGGEDLSEQMYHGHLPNRIAEGMVMEVAAVDQAVQIVVEQALDGERVKDSDRSPTGSLAWRTVEAHAPGGVWQALGLEVEDRGTISYQMPRDGAEGAWYRLQVRPVAGIEGGLPDAVDVQVEWLGTSGQILDRQMVSLAATADRLAWAPRRELQHIAQQQQVHLRCSAAAQVLRIHCEHPLLVRLFSRPVSVPFSQDLRKADVSNGLSSDGAAFAPAWHLIHPQHSERRIFLRWQESLNRRAETEPLAKRYRRVPADVSDGARMVLWPLGDLASKKRSLPWSESLFTRYDDGDALSPVRNLLLSGTLPGRWWRLSAEPKGAIRLQLDDTNNSSRWLFSNTGILTEDSYRSRPWWWRQPAVVASAAEPASFTVHKSSGEPMTVLVQAFYEQAGSELAALASRQVLVTIESLQDADDADHQIRHGYTFRKRILRFSELSHPNLLAYLDGEAQGTAVTGAITLWDDFPAGGYRIHVSPTQEQTLWVRCLQEHLDDRVPAGHELCWDCQGPAQLQLELDAQQVDWSTLSIRSLGTGGVVDIPLVPSRSEDDSMQTAALELPAGQQTLVLHNRGAVELALRLTTATDAQVELRRRSLGLEARSAERQLLAPRLSRRQYQVIPTGCLQVIDGLEDKQGVALHWQCRLPMLAEKAAYRLLVVGEDGQGRCRAFWQHHLLPQRDTMVWNVDKDTTVWSRSLSGSVVVPPWCVRLYLCCARSGQDVEQSWRPARNLLRLSWADTVEEHLQCIADPQLRDRGIQYVHPYRLSRLAPRVLGKLVRPHVGQWQDIIMRAGSLADTKGVGWQALHSEQRLEGIGPVAPSQALPAWRLPTKLEWYSIVPVLSVGEHTSIGEQQLWQRSQTMFVQRDDQLQTQNDYQMLEPDKQHGQVIVMSPLDAGVTNWEPGLFTKLTSTRGYTWTIPEADGERLPVDWQGRLLVKRSETKSTSSQLSVFLDDQLFWRETLRSSSTLIRLPRVAAGSHTLRLECTQADGAQFWFDGDVAPGTDRQQGAGQVYRLRRAFKMSQAGVLHVAVRHQVGRSEQVLFQVLVPQEHWPDATEWLQARWRVQSEGEGLRRMGRGFIQRPALPRHRLRDASGRTYLQPGSLTLRIPAAWPSGRYHLQLTVLDSKGVLARVLQSGGAEVDQFELRQRFEALLD